MFLVQSLGSSHSRRLVEYLKHFCDDIKCVAHLSMSGARIADVKRLFKQKSFEFQADVPLVIFVGGNDILGGAELDHVKSQYLSLVRLVRRRLPTISIFLACMPIFPRSKNKPAEVKNLMEFNFF